MKANNLPVKDLEGEMEYQEIMREHSLLARAKYCKITGSLKYASDKVAEIKHQENIKRNIRRDFKKRCDKVKANSKKKTALETVLEESQMTDSDIEAQQI